ncbi:SUN3 protein, partial [Eudromia elegans]|nr:SUN3 protein [Eudromia elegans]
FAVAFRLQPDVYPGHCWSFLGSHGQVVIKLPARIRPTALTMQHIFKNGSPSGSISSAPRDFNVSGVDAGGEEEALLGTFMYDMDREGMQTFSLKPQEVQVGETRRAE